MTGGIGIYALFAVGKNPVSRMTSPFPVQYELVGTKLYVAIYVAING